MKIELWKLHPREWRTNIKTRLLGFCDKKDCYDECLDDNNKFCFYHFEMLKAEDRKRREIIRLPGYPLETDEFIVINL